MRLTSRIVALVALTIGLVTGGSDLALARKTAKPDPCPPARYLIGGGPIGADGSGAALQLGPSTAIDGVCDSIAPRRMQVNRKGVTQVMVRWKRCTGLTGAVVLQGKIVPGCSRFQGTLKAKKLKKKLDAARSTCGDGIVDTGGGEQCDDGNTAAGDGCEPDCSPTPPVTTTTALAATSTTSTIVSPSSTSTTRAPRRIHDVDDHREQHQHDEHDVAEDRAQPRRGGESRSRGSGRAPHLRRDGDEPRPGGSGAGAAPPAHPDGRRELRLAVGRRPAADGVLRHAGHGVDARPASRGRQSHRRSGAHRGGQSRERIEHRGHRASGRRGGKSPGGRADDVAGRVRVATDTRAHAGRRSRAGGRPSRVRRPLRQSRRRRPARRAARRDAGARNHHRRRRRGHAGGGHRHVVPWVRSIRDRAESAGSA